VPWIEYVSCFINKYSKVPVEHYGKWCHKAIEWEKDNKCGNERANADGACVENSKINNANETGHLSVQGLGPGKHQKVSPYLKRDAKKNYNTTAHSKSL
jgi:hypothetical protein